MIRNIGMIPLLITLYFVHSFGSEFDIPFNTQRYMSSTRSIGLAQSGSAIPEPAQSIFLNPALVHAWHLLSKKEHSVSAIYGKDSLFSKSIISFAGSKFVKNKMVASTVYRYFRKSDKQWQNDIVAHTAGELFSNNGDQGSVSYGVNIRTEIMNWEEIEPIALPRKIAYQVKDVTVLTKDTVYMTEPLPREISEKRMLFDLGLYQSNIVTGLDFSVVFYNLLGLRWREEKGYTENSHKKVFTSNQDTLLIIDSTVYNGGTRKIDSKRHPKEYKRMTIGLAYHYAFSEGAFMIMIPLDVHINSVFTKKHRTGEIRTGIETWFKNVFALRFGYGYGPRYIRNSKNGYDMSQEHNIAGGASLWVQNGALDFSITKEKEWTLSVTTAF